MNRLSKTILTPAIVAVMLAGAFSAGAQNPPPPSGKQKGLQKPISGDEVKPAEGSLGKDVILVSLKGDLIAVNGQQTTLDGFSAAMTAAAAGDRKSKKVEFECAPEVTADQLYAVQSQLQDLGMSKVRFRWGGKGGQVPLVLPSDEALARMASLPPEDILEIRLHDDNTITVEGHTAAPGKLQSRIAERLAANDKIVVSLIPDHDCRYNAIVGAIDRLTNAGAQRIALNEPQ
ncbi:MAG: ExbD/TolR family protein [Candidatus Krumholzibacteriia bacterium]